MSADVVGRFAPSPSGALHVGNLRTGILAYLLARAEGGRFLIRVEDLDPESSRDELVDVQLADLAALGLTSDGPILRQSTPAVRARHEAAVTELERRGLLYPCWCSRREVADAAAAAHGPLPGGAYPGTCRDLDAAGRARRQAERPDKPPAWRVSTGGVEVGFEDRFHGTVCGVLDDFIVRRGDGVPAYNLAVVVDDADQGVTQVVRGDDLLLGTTRQAWLADQLGIDRPEWAHVPLVLGPDGERLAKRHGAVSLDGLSADGVPVDALLGWMAGTFGIDPPPSAATLSDLEARFDPDALPLTPVTFDAATLGS